MEISIRRFSLLSRIKSVFGTVPLPSGTPAASKAMTAQPMYTEVLIPAQPYLSLRKPRTTL
eukprot:3777675-Amphidinium_carterae.1